MILVKHVSLSVALTCESAVAAINLRCLQCLEGKSRGHLVILLKRFNLSIQSNWRRAINNVESTG